MLSSYNCSHTHTNTHTCVHTFTHSPPTHMLYKYTATAPLLHCSAASCTEESLHFLMDSAVRGRTEIVSIDFIFGRLRFGHLVLQFTSSSSSHRSLTHTKFLSTHCTICHLCLGLIPLCLCRTLSILLLPSFSGHQLLFSPLLAVRVVLGSHRLQNEMKLPAFKHSLIV